MPSTQDSSSLVRAVIRFGGEWWDIELDAKGLAIFVRDAAGEVTWEVPSKR